MMCSARARVTFNSDRMDDRWPALIIRRSRRPGKYGVRPAVYGELGGGDGGEHRAPSPSPGSQFSLGLHLTTQSWETNKKIDSPTQDSSLAGPPSAALSVRVSPSGQAGTGEPLTRLAVRAH